MATDVLSADGETIESLFRVGPGPVIGTIDRTLNSTGRRKLWGDQLCAIGSWGAGNEGEPVIVKAGTVN